MLVHSLVRVSAEVCDYAVEIDLMHALLAFFVGGSQHGLTGMQSWVVIVNNPQYGKPNFVPLLQSVEAMCQQQSTAMITTAAKVTTTGTISAVDTTTAMPLLYDEQVATMLIQSNLVSMLMEDQNWIFALKPLIDSFAHSNASIFVHFWKTLCGKYLEEKYSTEQQVQLQFR